MFRRGSSNLALVFLGLLLAAGVYFVKHPHFEQARGEAAVFLASRPAPVAVEIDHIVDGDTFRIFVNLDGGRRVSAPVRIRGVDTPELHGQCDAEIRAAREASRALSDLLKNGDVLLDQIASDRYERVLARVQVRQNGGLRDVAQVMVRAGYGRAYDGRKRAGWC